MGFFCGANSSKLPVHIFKTLPMPSQSTLIFSVHNWEKREYYINWEYYINAYLVFSVLVKCCFFNQNFQFIRITKNLFSRIAKLFLRTVCFLKSPLKFRKKLVNVNNWLLWSRFSKCLEDHWWYLQHLNVFWSMCNINIFKILVKAPSSTEWL